MLHPDSAYIQHTTWLEKDNRAYDGTTDDWFKLLRNEYQSKNKTKIGAEVVSGIEPTQSKGNLEAALQRVEQNKQPRS